MTREEAIKWLIYPTITTTGEAKGIQKKQLDAYHMAIEALLTNQYAKNERSDLISRAEAIKRFCEFGTQAERQGKTMMTMVDAKYAFIETLESMPSVAERCEDCEFWNDTEDGCADRHNCKTEPSDLISRAEAIKAIKDLHGGCITDNVKDITEYVLLGVPSVSTEAPTTEVETSTNTSTDFISRAELTKHFKTFDEKYLTLDTICDEVQSAPSVSVSQGNLISRAEAIEAITEFMKPFIGVKGDMGAAFNSAREMIKDTDVVPSVSAERVGVWVRKEEELNDCDGHRAYYWQECSKCGATPPKDQWENEWHSPYCPNCGARMENTK